MFNLEAQDSHRLYCDIIHMSEYKALKAQKITSLHPLPEVLELVARPHLQHEDPDSISVFERKRKNNPPASDVQLAFERSVY